MSLSVACQTNDVGPRFVATLGQLRSVADEIVVAVDSRVDPAHLGDCAALADRLLRVEFTSAARSLSWLHHQCSCDWILLLGSDELVSPGLIAQLPELLSTRDVLQYLIPTRWLFPDLDHWLDERPWYPDYHNRLVRNDATLSFQGIKHHEATLRFPARYLEAPIYHLDCVLTSTEARRSKVAAYEASRPGLAAPGGGGLNSTYYLPEDQLLLPPRLVPQEDRLALAAVMQASSAGHSAPADIHLADQAEVDRYLTGRELKANAYRARIEPLERDVLMLAGEHRTFSLRITNEGDAHWPWNDSPEIRLSYHLFGPGSLPTKTEGVRTDLTTPVVPGESFVLPASVLAPARSGDYVVEFDMIHEHVRWFDCPLRVPMTVVAAPRARSLTTNASAAMPIKTRSL